MIALNALKRCWWLPAAMWLFCAAGCGQIVHVENARGEPIENVRITTQFSMEDGSGPGPEGVTNRFGDAMLKFTPHGKQPLWMNFTCQGYRSLGIAYPHDAKVNIVMQKISGE